VKHARVATIALILITLGCWSAGASAAAAQADGPGGAEEPQARSVIFMVTDGMSMGTLKMADTLIRERTGRASHWMSWMASTPGVRQGLVDTEPADGLVTDSAAAGSAWGIGELVRNGRINVTPDGREPAPLLIRAAKVGKATGVVSTARITHATPASFYANVERRNDEDVIARQLIERPIDIMLGGGARHVPESLLGADENVHVVENRTDLLATLTGEPPRRLLGLFSASHMSYEMDRPSGEPSLADMTAVALSHLSRDPDGFVLQVEGARVDHAAHDNDAAAMLNDQIAFDEAIGVAIDYLRAHPDTLLIVTTDHANANPGLSIYLERGAERFSRLLEAEHSFEWIDAQWAGMSADRRTLEAYAGLVEEATAIELSERERAIVGEWLSGRDVHPFDELNRKHAPLGSVLANHTGVSFMSTHHTNDPVVLTAMGPGAERVRALQSIADVHAIICEAAGIPTPPAPPAGARRDVKRLWDEGDEAMRRARGRGASEAPASPAKTTPSPGGR